MTNLTNFVNELTAQDFRTVQSLMRAKAKDESFKQELDSIKDQVKENEKAQKLESRNELARIGKEKVIAAGINGKINVLYNKEQIEVSIRSIDPNKNTFGINIEGDPSEKLWRYYYQVC